MSLAAFGAPAAGEEAPDPSVLHGPRAITAGSDGALWVADALGIMRVTVDGRFSRVLRADSLRAITGGADGSIWFTQSSPPRIGRIAGGGGIDYFSAGISGAVGGITLGPDGNVWFTEDEGRIGRITRTGVVTEFRQGLKPHSQPVQITPGRGGNLWFSDYAGRIGRVTPRGKITEFPVPYNDDGPEALAAGRDGALWYGTDNKVGRMKPGGRVRLFKVPFLFVHGIALGSDGSMWATGYVAERDFGAAVARVTPRGKVRVFRAGLSGFDTAAVARGPGAALSVAEEGRKVTENGRQADGIARISVKGAVRELPPTPPCIVPRVARYPLALVDDVRFTALCGLDARSRRTGKRARTVALGVSPRPGASLPFNTSLRVRFGPVPPLPKRCRLPFGGERLLATPHLLAFSYTDWNSAGDESTTHYGACLLPHGKLRRVTRSIDELLAYSEASGFKATGDFIVYSFFSIDHYNQSETSLTVYDVRRAHHVMSVGVERHGGDLNEDPPNNPLLGEYVVSEHGAVAWLSHEGSTIRLFAQPRGGATRELDSAMSLSGLEFSGDTLSWTSGAGERKSAEVR